MDKEWIRNRVVSLSFENVIMKMPLKGTSRDLKGQLISQQPEFHEHCPLKSMTVQKTMTSLEQTCAWFY